MRTSLKVTAKLQFMKTQDVRFLLKNAVKYSANFTYDEFEKISNRFDDTPVYFAYKFINDFEVEVSTDNAIFGYLNYGTSVRYALMSPDWKSKTAPNSLAVGGGAGRVLTANLNNPRPGIKARNFDKLIAKLTEKFFSNEVEKWLKALNI